MSLRYFTSTDRLLRKEIKRHAIQLLSSNPRLNIPTNNNVNHHESPFSPTPTHSNKVNDEVNYALALDLNRRPRLSRKGSSTILIHPKKQATEMERVMALFTAQKWGWSDPLLTVKEKKPNSRSSVPPDSL